MTERTEILQFNVYRSRRFSEADEARERFAEQHGCKDFSEVTQKGIQAVGRGDEAREATKWPLPPQGELVEQARKLLGLPPLNESDDRETGEVA